MDLMPRGAHTFAYFVCSACYLLVYIHFQFLSFFIYKKLKNKACKMSELSIRTHVHTQSQKLLAVQM